MNLLARMALLVILLNRNKKDKKKILTVEDNNAIMYLCERWWRIEMIRIDYKKVKEERGRERQWLKVKAKSERLEEKVRPRAAKCIL